ncbi:hypothetical protein NEOLI_005278 [Neolecta irregularis DAH-3]|uniref:Uncharacterized protein n=1 Tax=Neolecta irregularis (strain DAH-3) TaxID=1198029 RepID=A0A1U7LT84_NEOID|nr:hypothetical protein NEOLI_005278 [Neolecta irregularis DAH-3]|eukprot:OLL25839.1 hypothetical protein NEOLI_005278 [Neolecta irregularis DAH-3]
MNIVRDADPIRKGWIRGRYGRAIAILHSIKYNPEFKYNLVRLKSSDLHLRPDQNLNEKRNHDDSKINHDDSKINHDDSKINHDDSKRNPDDSKINHDDSKRNPDDSKRNPNHSKRNPGDSKRNPNHSKRNPGDSKRNPDDSKINPDDSNLQSKSNSDSNQATLHSDRLKSLFTPTESFNLFGADEPDTIIQSPTKPDIQPLALPLMFPHFDNPNTHIHSVFAKVNRPPFLCRRKREDLLAEWEENRAALTDDWKRKRKDALRRKRKQQLMNKRKPLAI